MLRKIIPVLVLGFLALPCYADRLAGPMYTGTSLASGFPTFYFYGAVDATRNKTWCPPEEMGIDEIKDVAVTRFRELPKKRLSESCGALLVEILEKKFPCGKVRKEAVSPEMTGSQLLEHVPPGSIGKEVNDYISGVSDSTRGKAWCLRWILKPSDVNIEVFSLIRKFPQDRLRENAATLVMEALHKLAPCRKPNTSIMRN